MSRIFIRYAHPRDVPRLLKDEVITGPPPGTDTWEKRIALWLTEQNSGHRVVLVAENETGLLGCVQLVFKFPAGYDDPEAANGYDVAMIESLRLKHGAPPTLATQLLSDLQTLARKKNIKTMTFCIPMSQTKAIAQVKAWGFEEFRIMPEPTKMLAFFRKSVE